MTNPNNKCVGFGSPSFATTKMKKNQTYQKGLVLPHKMMWNQTF